MWLRQGFIHRQRQPLSILGADPVAACFPACLVQQLVGFCRVKGQFVAEIDKASGGIGNYRLRLRIVSREEGLDHLFCIGGMQQRLAHANIGDQRVIRTEANAVVHPAGRGGIDFIALIGRLLFVIRLHLANKVGLTGQQGADAHAVFLSDDKLDAIKIGWPLLRQIFGPPLVVLTCFQRHFATQLLVLHHKRARANDMPGVTQLFKIALERAERDQARPDGGGALQESR